MQVILLERIAKLGQMGETVKVRDGFARNYLLPLGKALRANAANKTRFESERATLEARNLERKGEAQKVADVLDGKSFNVVRSAGDQEDTGTLGCAPRDHLLRQRTQQRFVSVDQGGERGFRVIVRDSDRDRGERGLKSRAVAAGRAGERSEFDKAFAHLVHPAQARENPDGVGAL